MIKSLFESLIGGWKKILVYLGLAALLFGSGVYYGNSYCKGQTAKQEVTEIKKEVAAKDQNQAAADTSGETLTKKNEKTQIVYKTIEKKVIVYAQKNPTANDPIGVDWVHIYNDSARGENTPEGEPVDVSTVPGTPTDHTGPGKSN